MYTSIKDAINDIRYINEYEYSWEFNFKKLAFDISLYQNRTDTEKNLQELKELKSKPEIDDFNEK
ncbi:MAG: hypothetical protein IPJ39_22800 [Saprospiraceae bacterium]|nr:hypothetical protein [Saprospiraceae bacterium]